MHDPRLGRWRNSIQLIGSRWRVLGRLLSLTLFAMVLPGHPLPQHREPGVQARFTALAGQIQR